jgi:hypothetical protein
MTSALSITRAVNPPRAAYLDFPLGHTSGKPHQSRLNQDILRGALVAFEKQTKPGEIVMLPYEWADDDGWKDAVMRPRASSDGHGDARVERVAQPQYQTEADRTMAQRTLTRGGCTTCIWLEDEPA